MQNVADDGAHGRRDNPYAVGKKGKWALARFVKQSFRREEPAPLFEKSDTAPECRIFTPSESDKVTSAPKFSPFTGAGARKTVQNFVDLRVFSGKQAHDQFRPRAV